MAISLIVASLLTPSFLTEHPVYHLGDIADRNIKAKRDFLIENEAETTRRRDEAVRQAPVVYDLDENIEQQAVGRLESAFQSMRENLPEEPSSMPGSEIRMKRPADASSQASLPASTLSGEFPDFRPDTLKRKRDFESLLGFPVSEETFASLRTNHFSREIQDKIGLLVKSAFERGIVSTKAWLVSAGESGRLVVRKSATHEEMLVLPPYEYPDLEEARKMIRMQAMEHGEDIREMPVLAGIASQLLQANYTFNLEETQFRREKAYAGVTPTFVKIQKNEMLVREGQRIGPEEILRLKAHDQGSAGLHWTLIFLALFVFSVFSIWVPVRVGKEHLPSFRMETNDFLFLGIVLVFLLLLGRAGLWVGDLAGDSSAAVARALLYAVPVSAGAMVASIFFGVAVSFIFSLIVTLFMGMIFGRDFGLFFYFLIGSLVALHGVIPCRNRMTPIKAGLLVGCSNMILVVFAAVLHDQIVLLRILVNALFGFWGGVFAGILVTGITPLAEAVFKLTTDMRLLELAAMDQPLLQELMVQAPGTYHHSIIVGNLVETSAKSIGANALLAKVAAYYHDIGKTKKPLYFIENQFGGENRHEKLAPSMSSLILTSHVKEGVELARRNKLGKNIIDIIEQHHGKSFISFFYKKAIDVREKKLQIAKAAKGVLPPPIDADDYRYPGPKPQTKEAGLVMLADVVEAACRSLTDPTPARIQGMVNRLINSVFSDGQLDECELTLKDLHQIAKHFHQILATVHHKRIVYPSNPPSEGKAKTDAPDSAQRESRQDRDKAGAGRENGKPDLKRLGM